MEEIREKIRAGHIKEAIEDLLAYTKLEQKYISDVELLYSRYRELKRKEINRIISDQEYKLAHNQLTYDILSLINLLEDKHHINSSKKPFKLFFSLAFFTVVLTLLITSIYFYTDSLGEENKSEVVKPLGGDESAAEISETSSGEIIKLPNEENRQSFIKKHPLKIRLDESLPEVLQQKLEERAFEISDTGEQGQSVSFTYSGVLENLGDGLFYYPGGQIRLLIDDESFETGIQLSSTLDLGNSKVFVLQEIDRMIIQAISKEDNIDHISRILKNNL